MTKEQGKSHMLIVLGKDIPFWKENEKGIINIFFTHTQDSWIRCSFITEKGRLETKVFKSLWILPLTPNSGFLNHQGSCHSSPRKVSQPLVSQQPACCAEACLFPSALISTSYSDSLFECRVDSGLMESRGIPLQMPIRFVTELLSGDIPKAFLPLPMLPENMWAQNRSQLLSTPFYTLSLGLWTLSLQAWLPFLSFLIQINSDHPRKWDKIPICLLELQTWDLFIPRTERPNSLSAITSTPRCSRGNLCFKSNRE